MNFKIIDVDIAWDNSYGSSENLGTQLEALRKLIPNSFVRVWKYEGSGGGWPNIEIVFPEDQSEVLAEWLGQTDDMKFFYESLSDFEL